MIAIKDGNHPGENNTIENKTGVTSSTHQSTNEESSKSQPVEALEK